MYNFITKNRFHSVSQQCKMTQRVKSFTFLQPTRRQDYHIYCWRNWSKQYLYLKVPNAAIERLVKELPREVLPPYLILPSSSNVSTTEFRFPIVLGKLQTLGTCQFFVLAWREQWPLRFLRCKPVSSTATVIHSRVVCHKAHYLFILSLHIINKKKN